ncbi:prepilin-type N-terminal cleavage/methylation domain-containing protein [Patescibacteria group bacterium]|nr:prepilin-type N-terminal cleavage/methylation domain-containing protein [Patescibacteria group bacterium]
MKKMKYQIANKKQGKGFTLIELLIVVAIIGVLASLLMANFIGVRQRGRDAQRKSDVRQIQSALELYRADMSSYPLASSNPLACGSSLMSGTTTYMKKIPCDPQNPTTQKYVYSYSATNGTYTIKACLENSNDSQLDATNTCSPGYSMTFSSP